MVDRGLYCIACPSIYGFYLPHWYRIMFLVTVHISTFSAYTSITKGITRSYQRFGI